MPPSYAPYKITKIISETEDTRTYRLVPASPLPTANTQPAAAPLPSATAHSSSPLPFALAPPSPAPLPSANTQPASAPPASRPAAAGLAPSPVPDAAASVLHQPSAGCSGLTAAPLPSATSSPLPPSFLPGQFFILRMPSPPPELKPPFRSYSSLSPSGQPFLEFGVKKHGAFTTLLFGMKEGAIIEVAGPYGLFTLPEAISTPLVFLAGGIGITPLACHIQYLVQSSHPLPFFLFYSNRHENEIAYRGLIDSLSDLNPNFTPVYTLTGIDSPADWEGEKGRISIPMLQKHIGNIPLTSCCFYLCGSPPFVGSLIELLKSSSVPQEKIHKEQW